MQYRKIGGTDLDVSAICMGPMRGAARDPENEAKYELGERALHRAIDLGVNFLHTSYEYGTRPMLARILKNHPKRGELHHAIKVPVPNRDPEGRFDPALFRTYIEDALRDLHAERISVLQYSIRVIPKDDATRIACLERIVGEVVETFERMRREGKVGYLMMFPATVPVARAAIATGKFSGLIGYYGAVEMEMFDVFPELERRGMGFLAIRPLWRGLLTDKRPDQASLAAGDRLVGDENKWLFARRAKIVETFRAEIGDSMTSFAIRLALASPLVASVVVGLNTPEQVDEMVAIASEEPLPAGTLERAYALWQSGFGLT